MALSARAGSSNQSPLRQSWTTTLRRFVPLCQRSITAMPSFSRCASSFSMAAASRTAAAVEMGLPSVLGYGLPYFRDGDRRDDPRAAAGGAHDLEPAVERLDAVGKAE